ncbi:MAG: hypothetical protein AB9883_05875 [Acidaminococcaceae bacterium]
MLGKFFEFQIYKTTTITLALVPIAVALFFILSPPVAYENGPLENLQVVQLVIGALVAFTAARKAFDKNARNIWYCGAVTFLICAGRELNWGRVFYPVADHNKFLPLKALWYGPGVYPFLTAIILVTIYMLWLSNLFSYIVKTKIPFWDFILFVLLYLAANYAEHRPMLFWGQHFDGEILEELFECLCYWLLTDITRIMGFVNRKNIDF